MHVDQLIELSFGRIGEVGMDADTRIVHQEVEPLALPMLRDHLAQTDREFDEAPRVCDVQRQCTGLAAECRDVRDHCRRFFAAAQVGDDDVGTAPRKMHCGALAEAAAAAGDECNGSRGGAHEVWVLMKAKPTVL